MKSTDPRILSALMAIFITAFISVAALVMEYFTSGIHPAGLLINAVVVFVFCYFLIRYFLEDFIYEKIRVIYKTISRSKAARKEEKRIHRRADMVAKVKEEVMEWEKSRSDEIARLKDLENYRREFLGNISHELKSPIFNIQGYVLTLLDGGLKDPAINKTYLMRAERSINRMIAIVEDLETISQLESSELKLDLKPFDLTTLAREVVEALEMKARKKNNELHLAGSHERPVVVLADIKRIRQVLINLVENAINYGKPDGGKTRISFFDMDENILVEVTDNGEGIAEKDLSRLFERFYRTDKARSREQGGTGLGLAIVKHIIEAHNQSINVRSTVGVGSTFGFTLKKGLWGNYDPSLCK